MVQLNAGIWSLYVGATAFLIARLYSKRSRNHRLWYDDYILLFAWVSPIYVPTIQTCLVTNDGTDHPFSQQHPHYD